MRSSPLRNRIALLDVEASGLMRGAFPVEVAWWSEKSEDDLIIDPTDSWDTSKWDADAEAMHGLTVGELKRKGRHPRIVAARLNQAFEGLLVFCDSPAHDVGWLDMLHDAGGVKRDYKVESIGKLLGHLGIDPDRAYELFDEMRNRHPPRGRGREGVHYLKAVFEAALRESSR